MAVSSCTGLTPDYVFKMCLSQHFHVEYIVQQVAVSDKSEIVVSV
ncbi:hypothetical protein [Acinetobacter sp. MB5]|nr:hypothetical protein [Acinetobacter sp. MB5]